VEVAGKILAAPKIVIATGARPRIPDIAGLAALPMLTSENLWSLTELPGRLLILGGGPIGCEMAQAFQRLGSQVTLVQRGARLLPKADAEAAALIENTLVAEGVTLMVSCQIKEFRQQHGDNLVVIQCGDREQQIAFDRVLVAVGRQANTAGLGLDDLRIPLRDDGTVETNDYLQTNYPTIFACGDVCGPYQFTHASSHQAWYAMVNALFGGFKKFRVDYRLIPSVVYTDPEVAALGLTEEQALAQGVQYEVTKYPLSGLDRGITDNATDGFVKVLTAPGRDNILGVTIVASRAGDMLMEFAATMKQSKGLNSILATIHPYPIFSEANKAAAGQWKRSHTPEKLLRWVAGYHRWRLK
jgi:pyruvate/2-oxoglutarate dehydrogenase complex dihydrolipoamide dehydrogenase (E3) component